MRDSAVTAKQQPDKVLFDRAMYALGSSRFDIAALDFQTLINTYPDSKYVVMAKMTLEHNPHLAECAPSADMNIVFRSNEKSCDH